MLKDRRKILDMCTCRKKTAGGRNTATLPGSLSEEATNSGFPAGALQRRSESELPLPGPQNGRNGDGNADTAGAGREAETAHPGEVF
ncbi:hypothetical protein LFZ39_23395 [Salmonella enterica subsp. enterica serovar Pullorum]|nr:hypothetical protein LFZ39_23395 [Salmonella enterica subsp. enterica serovar Pullorum]